MTESRDQLLLRLAVSRKHLDASAAQGVADEAASTGRPVDQILLRRELVTPHGLELLLEELARSQEPTVIGGCRLISRLGQGGMGTVYLAYQLSMERQVAIKVLSPDLQKKKGFAERFLREAQAVAKLNHPQVVGCYDAGQDQGNLYMVLELMPGGDAERLMRKHGGRLPAQQALEIVRDAAAGVEALHLAGLVHRDLKPANLFLTEDGRAKVGDLGLARAEDGEDRMTKTGVAMGTPAYMSPEQAEGEIVLDVRSDLYGLGATLFTLVTGVQPYTGASPFAIVAKVINDVVPDPRQTVPDLPEAARILIRRAMAKDPKRRHQTPAEFIEACTAALASLDAPAPTPRSRRSSPSAGDRSNASGPRLLASDVRRKVAPGRLAWLLPLGIGAVLVAVALVIVFTSRSPEQPRTPGTLQASTLIPDPAGSTSPAASPVPAVPEVRTLSTATAEDLFPRPGVAWGITESDRWCALVARTALDPQIEQVRQALVVLNPGLKAEAIQATVFEDRLLALTIDEARTLSDIRPLAALTKLPVLRIQVPGGQVSALSDLRPLAATALVEVHLGNTRVVDLAPLKGKALVSVTLLGSPASDLRPVVNRALRRIAFDPREVKHGLEELRAQGGIRIVLPLGAEMAAGDFWRRWDRDRLERYFSTGGREADL